MDEHVPAAVLVPLFRDAAGELRLVLVVRGEGGRHGGQLGLPGGKREPADASLLDTALREAEEEVGLGADDVDVLAEFEPIDSRVTGYRVHPFLATVRAPERWRLAHGEIAGVVTPRVRDVSDRTDEAGVTLDEGRLLWGLTLRVLDAVLPRVVAGEWPV
jgi:8-oxo-dGTP pyrophosphatase MutT (NUDIX family)